MFTLKSIVKFTRF